MLTVAPIAFTSDGRAPQMEQVNRYGHQRASLAEMHPTPPVTASRGRVLSSTPAPARPVPIAATRSSAKSTRTAPRSTSLRHLDISLATANRSAAGSASTPA